MALLVTNIIWLERGDPKIEIAERLNISSHQIEEATLLKRTVDGRRRPPVWHANYKVEVTCNEIDLLGHNIHGVRAYTSRDDARYNGATWKETPRHPWPKGVEPIVVGAGPAGLFAALRLAECGAPVTLLERGGPVEKRHYDVRAFWRHGDLDPHSNVIYGEGGAGAFSDGKIYTRRRDGELGWLFTRLVDFGADPEILKEGWAHLGTDRIRAILPRLRARLLALGTTVRFNTTVTEILKEGNAAVGVQLANGEILRGAPVLMATGHSARDAFAMMIRAGAAATQRPIHVGVRIEHPQKLIDLARYGKAREDLPAASYRLTSNPRDGAREAHTFCMCPGGTIVAASNHPDRVVVNGMSYSKRQAFYANSAIVVPVNPTDYGGSDPLAGVYFQDAIEEKAFQMGGGEFRAPAQRVDDFLANRGSTELGKVTYPLGVTPSNLHDLFPSFILDGLHAAIRHFDHQIPGFASAEGILVAPESRTTSPVRFERDENYFSTTLPGLMPLGEGAGHAGGIASAALDGFNAAMVLVNKHAPKRA
jgi:uncharacterized FAD-dependent dehydrogenase